MRAVLARAVKRVAARTAIATTRSLGGGAASGSSYSKQFYKVNKADLEDRAWLQPGGGDASNSAARTAALPDQIVGEVVDNAVNLTGARPGDSVDVPYEVTVSPAIRDFWQSAFYSHDRINTSTVFARHLGLQDQIVPFSLMLFLTGAMSHADHAKAQTGYRNAKYHWPAFAGDTFRKRFTIQSLRTTSDGRHSIFNILCELRNQRDRIVFTTEKTMLFPFKVPGSTVTSEAAEDAGSDFLDHLIRQTETLQDIGSQTLMSLRPGQLILHTLARPLSETHMMQLATLGRLTHERHFNTRLYKKSELYVPGGLVFGLATALASRDLHEVLYEELIECSFPNNLHPGETMGAMTFVGELEEHVSGDVEAINIRTVGVKNIDVARTLAQRALPMELFKPAPGKKMLRPAALEEVLKKHCPELCKLVVCMADRRVYRQAPKQVPFLL